VGKKKTTRYITYVHLNPLGVAQPTVGTLVAPQTVMPDVNSSPTGGEQGELVEIEVGGKKLRGRILKVLENERAILFIDENRVLHMIPLSELRKKITPVLI